MHIISVCPVNGQRQWRRVRKDGFGIGKRQRFLDALAMSCNVGSAARYAGVDKATPYSWRARDAQFAAQWREALAIGYERLETLALEHCGAGMALEPPDPDRVDPADPQAPPPFDFDKALLLLRLHRAQQRKRDAAPERASMRRPATREETNAALIKALTAAKKRLEKPGDS